MDEKELELNEPLPSDASDGLEDAVENNGLTSESVPATENTEAFGTELSDEGECFPANGVLLHEESVDESIVNDEGAVQSENYEETATDDDSPLQENQEEIGEDDEHTVLDDENKERKHFKADGIFEFIELFVFTIATVILILSFVCRHSIVDGDSMQNTLQDGEHLIISDLFYTPKRNDIIVFEDRSTGVDKPMVKRVIAVEGDSVKITEMGEVYVNGELLDEDYVFIDGYYNQKPIEYTVADGEVYVMGDHRNESSDSRIFGSIDADTILGKVIFRFYPFEKFGSVD